MMARPLPLLAVVCCLVLVACVTASSFSSYEPELEGGGAAAANVVEESSFPVSLLEEDDDTQLLLETARGCHIQRRLPRCVNARATAKHDRAWCLKHYRAHSPRCNRLDALERLVYGRDGTSRLARDLVRRCAGKGFSKAELLGLRRVLTRTTLSDGHASRLIQTLQRCALPKVQMDQLRRMVRIHSAQKLEKDLTIKTSTLNSEMARLRKESSALKGNKWLKRLQDFVGNAEDVKNKWITKMEKAARKYNPCDDIKCPADAECKRGKCVHIDRCKNVKCDKGHECDQKDGVCYEKSCTGIKCEKGQRCYLGGCISQESCEGIQCSAGQQCVLGKCTDVTVPSTCATTKCSPGYQCVEGDENSTVPGPKCVKKTPASNNAPVVVDDKSEEDKNAEWQAQEWTECSEPCGQPGGYRTRDVLCKYSNGKIAPELECASSGEKPEEKGECDCSKDDDAVTAEPEDEDGNWSKCSKRCEGTQKCIGSSCNGESTRACGRAACTVPDFHTVMRVCHGGPWTHCNCPKGYYPVTGGCDGTTWPHRWQYNNWNGANGWLCGGHKGKKTVHVICAHGVGACKWQTTDGGDWHRQLCPKDTTVMSGGCNAVGKPHLLRWQMKSGNGWLCGGWNGKKRTSVLCCDKKSVRPGCKTYTRRFGDWGHITCPKGTKLISGGCDADKPFLIRSSRPVNRNTWQCGGWGGNKLISVTCCTDHNDY